MSGKATKQGKLPPRWLKNTKENNGSTSKESNQQSQESEKHPDTAERNNSSGVQASDKTSAMAAEENTSAIIVREVGLENEIVRKPEFEKTKKLKTLFQSYFDYEGHKGRRFIVSCKICKGSLSVDDSSVIYNCTRHYKVIHKLCVFPAFQLQLV